MKTIHVIIDPQNDFVDDARNSPSLAVAGATEDMARLANVIAKDKVDAVLVTLDTHAVWDIAHTSWWRNADGLEISPFTPITSKDIEEGKFVCADPAMKEHSLAYTRALEAGGKFVHFIWPNHCIAGTKGHEVYETLATALSDWENKSGEKVDYLKKGTNPMTEHYSAFKAEVPVAGDDGTLLNKEKINYINSFERVVFSGEALSHCVRTSVLDFLEAIPQEDRKKVIVLSNCASAVSGFENSGVEFIELAKEMGAQIMTDEQYLSLNVAPKANKKRM